MPVEKSPCVMCGQPAAMSYDTLRGKEFVCLFHAKHVRERDWNARQQAADKAAGIQTQAYQPADPTSAFEKPDAGMRCMFATCDWVAENIGDVYQHLKEHGIVVWPFDPEKLPQSDCPFCEGKTKVGSSRRALVEQKLTIMRG